MGFVFEKATKEKALLRAAMFAPAGAGKTMTSLRMARGMVESPFAPAGARAVLVDTEFRSASKYADRFDFDTVSLTRPTIEQATAVLEEATKAGYFVLIFDSITHVWHELLMEVDRLARAKYRGNTHSAWAEGTPKQKEFTRALHKFGGHLIATMRERTAWEIEERDGKKIPVRLGTGPEQGKGLEYEFDLLMSINTEHIATVIKDRTGKYQDVIIERPDEEFGAELLGWLNDGVTPVKRVEEAEPEPLPTSQVRKVRARATETRVPSADAKPTTTTKVLLVSSVELAPDGIATIGEDAVWKFSLSDGRKARPFETTDHLIGAAAVRANESGNWQTVTFETRDGGRLVPVDIRDVPVEAPPVEEG